MDRRKLWLMDSNAYEKFVAYRRSMYGPGQADIEDTLLTKYYLEIMINFLRRRKISREQPFRIQRLVHTSVSLFKRYYLVNEYNEDEEPSQLIFCCMYLALKLNEYTESQIRDTADNWRQKKEPKVLFAKPYLHFGDEDYIKKQLSLLNGIGFQISRSPMIQPLESLYHQICNSLTPLEPTDLLEQILKSTEKVYYDDTCMFLNPGPEIALAIISHQLRKCEPQNEHKWQQIFGPQIEAIIHTHQQAIYQLGNQIDEMQLHKSKLQSDKLIEYRNRIKRRKKGFEHPGKKSPRMGPKSFLEGSYEPL